MAEDEVYKVMLVLDPTQLNPPSDGREVNAAFLYRGPLPDEGEEIDVENELKPDGRRRARVTRITRNHEPVIQGVLNHATELEP